jgi:hypothetical protein
MSFRLNSNAQVSFTWDFYGSNCKINHADGNLLACIFKGPSEFSPNYLELS